MRISWLGVENVLSPFGIGKGIGWFVMELNIGHGLLFHALFHPASRIQYITTVYANFWQQNFGIVQM
jgi:hypothetical protein